MPESNRVIVVLGMHRSGTSALAGVLLRLGVDLGDRLLPGGPKENPKGFFEDEWALDLSERLLAVLHKEWDSTSLMNASWWDLPEVSALKLEACEVLRERFGDSRLWGFKNPRTARLVPFWGAVFRHLGLDDSYLIVVRNPLSVARSLAARNGFDPAKSHLLWLLHLTEAYGNTRGKLRMFVDYDDLIDAPVECMARIARRLRIPLEPKKMRGLKGYARTFVSRRLRHTRFEDDDVPLDPRVSQLERRAFALARRLARDQVSDRNPRVQREWSEIRQNVESLGPVLAHLERLDAECAQLERVRVEQVAALEGELRGSREALAGEHAQRERLEAERGQLERARAEQVAALEGELRGTREALAGEQAQRERLEAERGQLERARAEQVATLEGELRGTREALAGGQAQRERLEAERGQLERARAEQVATLEGELRGSREALAGEQAQRERLERELVRAREEFETGRGRLRDQEAHILEARDELERTRRALTEERNEHEARLQRWLAEAAHDLTQLAEAMRHSRTWRTTRWLQRLLDRMRSYPSNDGLAALASQASCLWASCSRGPLVAADVRQQLGLLAETQVRIWASETYRVARGGAFLYNLLRLRVPPSGPAEQIPALLYAASWYLERVGEASHEADLEAVGPEQLPVDDTVDVIVPVYRNLDETLRCLDSVQRAQPQTKHELVVVDDSGEEGELARKLSELAENGAFTLIRNPANRGFVASANRGMSLHPHRDVVLLNADTVVHGDWLDRLRGAAYRDWRIGTVTPWSNNAEICSYPVPCRENELPNEPEIARLDAQFARANPGAIATLPTAVGFCSYLRRACLRDVGLFDEERFGSGYGEENDFSMRARQRGWRHVLAADTYVAHVGGVSFGEAKGPRIQEALRKIAEIHPSYLPEVQAFIREDPLRPLRRRADLALVGGEGPAILLVTHARGGGTERNVQDLAEGWEEEGVRAYVIRGARAGVVQLERHGFDPTPNLAFEIPSEQRLLVECLRTLEIRHVHFHHTLGLPDEVLQIPSELGVAYDFTAHDHFCICPRIHLIDASGSYCGEPQDPRVCSACVRANGSFVGSEIDVREWRDRFESVLAGARRVFVSSQDIAKRLPRYFPNAEYCLRPHPDVRVWPRRVALPPSRRPRRLRVAVIGAIGEHKGAAVLLACARDAEARELPVEFHLVGYSDRDTELSKFSNVKITGPYEEDEVFELIAAAGCQRALLPSQFPETYSYSLSIAWHARLYPLAFDLGAIAERIRDLGWGELVPLGTPAAEINDRLLSIEAPAFPEDRFERLRRTYTSLRVEYYEHPF